MIAVHEMQEKMEQVKSFKRKLCSILEEGLGDWKNQNASELGEIMDMIKDCSEIEKLCYEAKYYESVVEAMEEASYDDDDDDVRGYRRGRRRNSKGQYTSGQNMRRGFPEDDMMLRAKMMDKRDWRDGDDDNRYGSKFDRFRKARRNYTKTHSEKDKEEMQRYANDHLMETIMTVSEMYDDADPELKKKMKQMLNTLVSDMQ